MSKRNRIFSSIGLAAISLSALAPLAVASTTLEVYDDSSLGRPVAPDRGEVSIYVKCNSTDVDTCRGTLVAKKGKKTKTGTWEATAGNVAGATLKISKGTWKVCAKEKTTKAKDCAKVKVIS